MPRSHQPQYSAVYRGVATKYLPQVRDSAIRHSPATLRDPSEWACGNRGGFPDQVSQSVGTARLLIDAAPHALNAEIGAGSQQAESADGVTENDLIVRAGLGWKWQFSETAVITQDLIVESGQDNSYLESVAAITARLIGALALVASHTVKNNSALALVASHTVKNNSDVVVGTEETDTNSAVLFAYHF